VIVYKTTNKINGKFYIGITTKSLEIRKKAHQAHSKVKGFAFYKAIRKYGWENFEWSIIDSSAQTEEELNQLEIEYIDKLKPQYNMTKGGVGPLGLSFNHSQPTKDKISKFNKGKLFSKKTRDKISKSNTGKVRSQETKDKLSKINLGNKHTEESKRKISEASKRMWERRRNEELICSN